MPNPKIADCIVVMSAFTYNMLNSDDGNLKDGKIELYHYSLDVRVVSSKKLPKGISMLLIDPNDWEEMYA